MHKGAHWVRRLLNPHDPSVVPVLYINRVPRTIVHYNAPADTYHSLYRSWLPPEVPLHHLPILYLCNLRLHKSNSSNEQLSVGQEQPNLAVPLMQLLRQMEQRLSNLETWN